MLAGVLLWTASLQESWRQHLLNIWLWLPLTGVALVGMIALWFGLARRYAFLPLAAILVLVSCAFGALVFTLFPFIVPDNILIRQAAAPPATQRFLLVSFGLLVPITLIYNTWGFRVFSGKIH